MTGKDRKYFYWGAWGCLGQGGDGGPTSSGSEVVGNLWMMMLSAEHAIVNSCVHHVAIHIDPIFVELRNGTSKGREIPWQ